MHTLILIAHILVSIFLVASVLFQFGKGASIGSTFGSSTGQALFGGGGATTLLAKITIASAVIFMFTSLYLTYLAGAIDIGSVIQDVPAVSPLPAETPTQQPTP